MIIFLLISFGDHCKRTIQFNQTIQTHFKWPFFNGNTVFRPRFAKKKNHPQHCSMPEQSSSHIFLFRVAKRMNWLAFDPKPVSDVLRAKNIFSGCSYPHLQMWATKSPSFFWGATLHFLSRKKLLKIIGCGRLGSQEEEETSFPAQSGNCS